MELVHFGHEHPLAFKAEGTFEEEEKKLFNSNCYMCRRSISLPAYFCTKCDYIFLHEACAKLPQEIIHPMHSAHPLGLTTLAQPHRCDACWCDISGFYYKCLKCDLYVCILCSLRVSQGHIIKHGSHQHPLELVQKKAKFDCDACDFGLASESGSKSYICTACSFWIHDSCASLPTIKGCEEHDHHHPLTLAYHLPSEFQRYDFECESCCDKLGTEKWVYYCGPCRYFVHAKCEYPRNRVLEDHNLEQKADPQCVQLPCVDRYTAVMKPLIDKMLQTEIQPLTEIKHFSHKHPLIFSNAKFENEKKNEEILCDGCVEPISTHPYYACAECKYVLHLFCAHLPLELQHPSDGKHALFLKKFRNESGYFVFSHCHARGNEFLYECEDCHIQLDLNCAILPSTIIHKAHKQHVLIQVRGAWTSWLRCNACRKDLGGCPGYECDYCFRFNLHPECAKLPHSLKHRWDKHPLLLTYPPFSDNIPDEIYCDICEDEIHPKGWMYHCRECDQSFHPECIPRLGKDGRMKFGSTIRVDNHEHLLKSVRESRYKSSCNGCDRMFNGAKAWECRVCRFSWCFFCVRHAYDPGYVFPASYD